MPEVGEQERRKRKSRFQDSSDNANGSEASGKKIKVESPSVPNPSTVSGPPTAMDPNIRDIMQQAQRMIEQRKKEMHFSLPNKIAPDQAEKFFNETISQRAEDLKESIANRMKSISSLGSADRQLGLPKPLILDSAGRTIDTAGKEIRLAQREPTLKANIRAEKRAQFKKAVQETTQAVEEKGDEAAQFFDTRVMAKGAARQRRQMKFHDKGEFEQLANRMRAKARLEKLQLDIQSVAKKTGISSAVKLAMVAPRVSELGDFEVPNVEWWDSVILNESSYEDGIWKLDSTGVITNLVEHPVQLRPPGETGEPKYLKAYLTKKERKKLRRQNRKEAQREKQEKVRLGLEAPPEPKVKISNLMRVLGSQAIMDPTKMEAHVRDQMAKRLKKHEDANAARKLTKTQKSEKKIKKFKEAAGVGTQAAYQQQVHVAVYRVADLSNQSKKFKVEMNAKQLYLTGTVVIHKDVNVVVVEGGTKAQKFFKTLMLRRIKWEEDVIKDRSGGGAAVQNPDVEKPKNSCVLVWEGEVKKRSFNEIKFKVCPVEKLAREHFQKHGVEHYWDLAYSSSVLDEQGE